jgi:hypothetical protein
MKFQTLARAKPTALFGCGGLAFDGRRDEILVDLGDPISLEFNIKRITLLIANA